MGWVGCSGTIELNGVWLDDGEREKKEREDKREREVREGKREKRGERKWVSTISKYINYFKIV